MTTQYPDDFIAGVEWISGEGFLSPGGPAEVCALLEGIDLAGRHVLDVSSELGAIDVLLAREHRAASVVGINVEPHLVTRARQAAAQAGLAAWQEDCNTVRPHSAIGNKVPATLHLTPGNPDQPGVR